MPTHTIREQGIIMVYLRAQDWCVLSVFFVVAHLPYSHSRAGTHLCFCCDMISREILQVVFVVNARPFDPAMATADCRNRGWATTRIRRGRGFEGVRRGLQFHESLLLGLVESLGTFPIDMGTMSVVKVSERVQEVMHSYALRKSRSMRTLK